MATYDYRVGLGHVGSYQVAGAPFISGGIDASTTPTITFPAVTNWVIVNNAGPGDCKVGFSANGVAGNNYITLPSGSLSPRLELKVTELHLGGTSTNVDVVAGLTSIPVETINNTTISPSGSNWSGSWGVVVG